MILPFHLEVTDTMVISEMIFDYASHFKINPNDAAKSIDIYEYYEFLAYRNRRNELQSWLIENSMK